MAITPDAVMLLRALVVRCDGDCQARKEARLPVPPEIRLGAPVLCIGRNPGKDEDFQGRPFIGPSGKLLDTFLGQCGLSREQVSVSNTILCYTERNRPPEDAEVVHCHKWFTRVLTIAEPEIIFTFGGLALSKFFPSYKISTVHGEVFDYHGYKIVACYHPGAQLHQPSLRETMEKDAEKIAVFIGGMLL
jgi:uracil-DNA glycosylase family 4